MTTAPGRRRVSTLGSREVLRLEQHDLPEVARQVGTELLLEGCDGSVDVLARELGSTDVSVQELGEEARPLGHQGVDDWRQVEDDDTVRVLHSIGVRAGQDANGDSVPCRERGIPSGLEGVRLHQGGHTLGEIPLGGVGDRTGSNAHLLGKRVRDDPLELELVHELRSSRVSDHGRHVGRLDDRSDPVHEEIGVAEGAERPGQQQSGGQGQNREDGHDPRTDRASSSGPLALLSGEVAA